LEVIGSRYSSGEKGSTGMPSSNLLFTGAPGCGKSTLIEKILGEVRSPATGFFTREMREKGRRVGFSITTLDGRRGMLAHQDVNSPYRVGKYGVNVRDIDRIAVPSMIPRGAEQIVVIDEIGKMECFSSLFRKTLKKVLDLPNPVIGTISLKGDTFLQQIKERRDVRLVTVTIKNRDDLLRYGLESLESKPARTTPLKGDGKDMEPIGFP